MLKHAKIVTALLTFSLLLTTGCGVTLVKTENHELLSGCPRIDLENGPITATQSSIDPESKAFNWKNGGIDIEGTVSANYSSFYYNFVNLIAVKGQLPNGRDYTFWLDSGYPGYLLTNDLTIEENNFQIHPQGSNGWADTPEGIAYVPWLKIGDMTINNPPTNYLEQHLKFNLLGIPLWRHKGAIMGLGMMERFSYVSFDNPDKTARFSMDTFEPGDRHNWSSFPFTIRNGRLLVDIPMNGQTTRIMFDSCGSYGMVAKRSTWDKIATIAETTRPRRSSFTSGFLGKLPCEKARIRDLEIGGHHVRNAEVIILPEDSPHSVDSSYFSIKYFRDTTIVLDFDRNLFWIRKV